MDDWVSLAARVQQLVESYPPSWGEAYFESGEHPGEFEAGWETSMASLDLGNGVTNGEPSVLFVSWRINGLQTRLAEGHIELWETQESHATIREVVAGLGHHPVVLHTSTGWPRRWQLCCGGFTVDSSRRQPRSPATHLILPAWLLETSVGH